MSTGGLAGGRHPVLLAAALAGAAVMTVELAAVRLLAPSFGTSTVVWTNVIGVVLAALALGHALGARWCRGESAPKVLRTVLLGAAVWVGALPFLAPHVAGALLPERLTLDEALPLLRWGSLAVSILVLAPPVVVLGSVGPLCVELVQRSGVGHAGTSGGWVLGSSTLGSLVGTFATTNLLVPRFGVPATFASATAALILAAFVLRSRGGGVAAATAVAIGALFADAAPPTPPDSEGVRTELLAWRESPYQQVRVVEQVSGDERLRLLQVGEVSDSFQSVWQPSPGLLPEGYYYDDFALPLWWDPDQGGGEPRVLVLGLGAGTAWRVLAPSAPEGVRPVGVGIEIDPVVVELGRDFMDLDDERLEVLSGLDARVGLRVVDGAFDLVVVDTYAHQVEIPEHLCTLEFFQELRARLAPGGWIAVNAAGFGLDDPVVAALATTIATACDADVLALRVPRARNVTLFARPGGELVRPGDERFVPEEPTLARSARKRLAEGAHRVFTSSDGEPLRDGLNAMSLLQLESLALAHERTAPALP